MSDTPKPSASRAPQHEPIQGAIDLLGDVAEVLRDLAAGTTPDVMTVTTPKSFETLADDCEQYAERLGRVSASRAEPPTDEDEPPAQGREGVK